MFGMAAPYMIDGFPRRSNLLCRNCVVYCPSEVDATRPIRIHPAQTIHYALKDTRRTIGYECDAGTSLSRSDMLRFKFDLVRFNSADAEFPFGSDSI